MSKVTTKIKKIAVKNHNHKRSYYRFANNTSIFKSATKKPMIGSGVAKLHHIPNMETFAIIANVFWLFTVVAKVSILDGLTIHKYLFQKFKKLLLFQHGCLCELLFLVGGFLNT